MFNFQLNCSWAELARKTRHLDGKVYKRGVAHNTWKLTVMTIGFMVYQTQTHFLLVSWIANYSQVINYALVTITKFWRIIPLQYTKNKRKVPGTPRTHNHFLWVVNARAESSAWTPRGTLHRAECPVMLTSTRIPASNTFCYLSEILPKIFAVYNVSFIPSSCSPRRTKGAQIPFRCLSTESPVGRPQSRWSAAS